jgi:hypothetical protein
MWFIIVTLSKIHSLIHESEDKFIDKKNFLICKVCHWCASSLTGIRTSTICPSCSSNEMESMPISDYESYRLDNDYIHGLVSECGFDFIGGGLVR